MKESIFINVEFEVKNKKEAEILFKILATAKWLGINIDPGIMLIKEILLDGELYKWGDTLND